MEDDIEEGAVHVDATVVLQEAQLPELIHEETYAGPCGANHFGQHFLTDLRNDRLRLAFLPEMGHEQQHPRQPLLAGIEELIHQVFLDANVARQKIGQEQLGEGGFIVERTDHRLFVNAHDRGFFRSGCRGHAHHLPGETPFTEKAPGSSIATIASLPCDEITDSLTWPVWI